MLSCKAVQKCSAVCLLHKEINDEQKEKQLERSSGLAGGKSTIELYTGSSTYFKLMCAHDAQEYYFLFAHNQKIQRRLSKYDLATHKYETPYRGNISDIHNGVGDQYYIAMTGMVP